jgi:hypothetical protein
MDGWGVRKRRNSNSQKKESINCSQIVATKREKTFNCQQQNSSK